MLHNFYFEYRRRLCKYNACAILLHSTFDTDVRAVVIMLQSSAHPLITKMLHAQNICFTTSVLLLQPFCDGTHNFDSETHTKMTDPPIRSIKYKCEEDKTVFFCNCKQTNNPPFCDGSHKKLWSFFWAKGWFISEIEHMYYPIHIHSPTSQLKK